MYWYDYMFRNCWNWKKNPNYVKINERQLDGIADSIALHLSPVSSEEVPRDMLDGLAYVCAFLIIPYGREGRQYVEEKIAPATLEAFLWEKAQELLNTAEIFDTEENSKFWNLVRAYCQNYSRDSMPFGSVGAALLATRFRSEDLKRPRVLLGYLTPPDKKKNLMAFIRHHSAYFGSFRTNPPEVLDIPYHLEQLLSGHPEPTEFVFTDAHRREIDNLPMFTGFAKPPQAPSP